MDDNDCGGIGGMEIGMGIRSTRRKPAPVTLSTTNPHDLTRVRNRAAAVGNRLLTAWGMARLKLTTKIK
jgi:hypothetical protein